MDSAKLIKGVSPACETACGDYRENSILRRFLLNTPCMWKVEQKYRKHLHSLRIIVIWLKISFLYTPCMYLILKNTEWFIWTQIGRLKTAKQPRGNMIDGHQYSMNSERDQRLPLAKLRKRKWRFKGQLTGAVLGHCDPGRVGFLQPSIATTGATEQISVNRKFKGSFYGEKRSESK